jgi:hypothetical protein
MEHIETMPNIRDAILAEVAKACGVRPADLLSDQRGKKPHADARAIAMWLLYQINGRNGAAAGRVFGREQTTARTAILKVQADDRLRAIGERLLHFHRQDLMVINADATPPGLSGPSDHVEAPEPVGSSV